MLKLWQNQVVTKPKFWLWELEFWQILWKYALINHLLLSTFKWQYRNAWCHLYPVSWLGVFSPGHRKLPLPHCTGGAGWIFLAWEMVGSGALRCLRWRQADSPQGSLPRRQQAAAVTCTLACNGCPSPVVWLQASSSGQVAWSRGSRGRCSLPWAPRSWWPTARSRAPAGRWGCGQSCTGGRQKGGRGWWPVWQEEQEGAPCATPAQEDRSMDVPGLSPRSGMNTTQFNW